jgi:hypothetical protein
VLWVEWLTHGSVGREGIPAQHSYGCVMKYRGTGRYGKDVSQATHWNRPPGLPVHMYDTLEYAARNTNFRCWWQAGREPDCEDSPH